MFEDPEISKDLKDLKNLKISDQQNFVRDNIDRQTVGSGGLEQTVDSSATSEEHIPSREPASALDKLTTPDEKVNAQSFFYNVNEI